MADESVSLFRAHQPTENARSNILEIPSRRPSPERTVESAERRAHERVPINTQLQLRWEEKKGVQRQVRARAVDVSKVGVQVQTEKAIPTGTIVNVYSAQFAPIGRASVRHCTLKGMDYTIGLYMPDLFMQDL
jgi:c-di-GMP-binding flagellar brake protein YcgR